jgi:hypothetical protein
MAHRLLPEIHCKRRSGHGVSSTLAFSGGLRYGELGLDQRHVKVTARFGARSIKKRSASSLVGVWLTLVPNNYHNSLPPVS